MPKLRARFTLSCLLICCLAATACSSTPEDNSAQDNMGEPDAATTPSADMSSSGDMSASPDDMSGVTPTPDMGTADDMGTATPPDMTTSPVDMGMMQPDMDCEGEGDLLVCVEDDPRGLYRSDLCGNATRKKTTCSASLPCGTHSEDGQAYCECPLTGATQCQLQGSLSTLYEPTRIIKERECANARFEPTDVLSDCEWGSVCFQEEDYNGGVAQCHRSIDESQSNKPYYDFSCGTFAQWMRNPTKLEIDCRCRTTGDGSGGAGGMGNAFADPNNVDINNGARPGGPIINCTQPGTYTTKVWPIKYGTGPDFSQWYHQNASGASWFSGVFSPATREMFAIIRWTNPQYIRSASIVAWNVDTNVRRVVTGLHPDPQAGLQAYGSGYESPQPVMAPGEGLQQPLTGAHVLRWGPDGMLYTSGGGTGESSSNTREIVRVDPATGERTLVWMAQNDKTGDLTASFGQCFRPDSFGTLESVAFQSRAFEVGPDGTFYMSMRGVREGDGIVTISPDRQTCTIVSRWGGSGHNPGGGTPDTPVPPQIGAGEVFQFPVQGLLLHDGKLLGVSNSHLYSFDLTTGDRTKKSDDTGFDSMGFANMFWDPSRQVVWAVGDHSKNTGTIIDLNTGQREGIYSDTGLDDYGNNAILRSVYSATRSVSISMLGNGNSIGYGGVVLDPADPDILYAVLKSGGLMKMELSTFNTFVYSF